VEAGRTWQRHLFLSLQTRQLMLSGLYDMLHIVQRWRVTL
jgi:hypothetical protein